MTFVVSGCAGFPKITPTVIDTQLEEGRVYSVDKSGNLSGPIQYLTIQQMNGFYCLPAKQAAALKSWYLKNKKGMKNVSINNQCSKEPISEIQQFDSEFID